MTGTISHTTWDSKIPEKNYLRQFEGISWRNFQGIGLTDGGRK